VTSKSITALFAALLVSASAWAGLGVISVHSRLGEPFRAVVSLDAPETLDLAQAHIGLADRATFADLNVDDDPGLANLRFGLGEGASGPVIEIRSVKPMLNSYVNFVVELKSPYGRWIRAYTVRLSEALQIAPLPDAGPATAPEMAASRPSTITVPRGGTLASVARRVKPSGASLNQVMASLFAANPSSFSGRDPLRLKPGAQLKVPDAAHMRSLPESRARAMLRPKPAVHHEASGVPAEQPAHRLAALPAPVPASAPAAMPIAVEASQAAAAKADAARAASDAAEIGALQIKVSQRDKTLQEDNRRITDLQAKIKAWQASQAAGSERIGQFGGKHRWLIAGASGGALLFVALVGWWLLRRIRRKKPAADGPRSTLTMTGVVKPDLDGVKPGDGDPVAEADVYLAYGHEEQAEAILKQGLERQPSRQDIRYKLMELYAARPDRVRLEKLAREVHDAFDGHGPHWERARTLGASIDPDNALYRPEGAALDDEPPLDFSSIGGAASGEDSADIEAMLDMARTPAAETPPAMQEASPTDALLNFDFSLETPAAASGAEISAGGASGALARSEMADAMSAAAEAQDAPLSFDVEEIGAAPSTEEDDALSTKLDLAKVYLDMGDNEGAREVLNELLSEAKGALKQRAQDMLNTLGN
jgi:pilus assembly protein FimV